MGTGDGFDTAFGYESGDGLDIISGGSEGDTAFGDAGNDLVNGGDGGDSLFGEGGADTLFGGDFFDFGTFMGVDTPEILAGGSGDDAITVSNTAGAVDRVAWQAGDADGSTDRVSGLDDDGADQDLLDLSAVLTGLGGAGGAPSDFLAVSNDGVTTTILVDRAWSTAPMSICQLS
jgi:Ca2+-binding RTX toxin-like protein